MTMALLSLVVGTDLEKVLLMCPEKNNADIKIPNPHDCSGYFVCINDFPVAIFCPNGLHYNQVSRTCAPPEIANCIINDLQKANKNMVT